MSANPRKKTTIDKVDEPFYKDFFHKEKTWEVKSEGKKEKDNHNIEDKKIKNREGIEIKITSEKTFTSTFLKIPRCVPINVIVCCKKLHPDSEINTFNHYLEINGLESKIDLSIKNMRTYYEQSKISTTTETTEYMHKIVKYCIVDAKSSQRLMVEKNMINNYRGVASIAYISLFDSYYYAIGSFPEAYVYSSDKGLEAGQYNIKLVAEYVKKKSFEIKYGDTNSLYLKSPNNYYKECDLAYNNGKGTISKLEYWMEMVKITMKVIERLCNEEAVNFKPDELFIKEIDTIKQVMDINNVNSLYQIVEDVLKEAVSNPKQ
ncbi:10558_t:CDS:2 [Cetraspora pellucida]|uniref:10558_t:CDS:1 n=1 Tax=Cetraspora pellucida TaxID=1433469 RepID=A0ACA9LGN6_9GLOM|nr:10558_t:CDS:2 [Cetraspora pellucida]